MHEKRTNWLDDRRCEDVKKTCLDERHYVKKENCPEN